MNDNETLEFAADAAARIKKGSHLLDWFYVGAGFDIGCRIALTETGANDKSNKSYQNAFGRWMKQHPWTADFDKATRNHSIWLHENKTAVEEFLATLDGAKRLKMNHPTVVRRAWDRAHKPKEEPKEKPKQVKIDAEELQELHDQIDYLKQEGTSDVDNQDRIEELERSLDEANSEIARLRSQLEKANAEIEGFKSRISELPALVAQLDTAEFEQLKAPKGKARKRPQKGKDKPTEAVSSVPATTEAAFNK